MSHELSETTVRKTRQKPADAHERREVKAAVAPVATRIGAWQVALTMIRAKIGRGNVDPVKLTGACRAIAQEVASGRRIVQRAIPDRLRTHSRVVDVERALATIELQAVEFQRELVLRRGHPTRRDIRS
jgi:hypothetical protein